MSGRYRQQDFVPGQALLCRWDYVQGVQATPTLVLPDACVDLLWDGERLSIAAGRGLELICANPDRVVQVTWIIAAALIAGA